MIIMTVAGRSIWLWGAQIDDGSTESRFSAALNDVVVVFYWHEAHLLLWKWSRLCILPPVGFFLRLVISLYNICVAIVFLLMLYVSTYKLVWICLSLWHQICCHSNQICWNRNFLVVPVLSFCVLSTWSPSWLFFLVCEIELSCQGP